MAPSHWANKEHHWQKSLQKRSITLASLLNKRSVDGWISSTPRLTALLFILTQSDMAFNDIFGRVPTYRYTFPQSANSISEHIWLRFFVFLFLLLYLEQLSQPVPRYFSFISVTTLCRGSFFFKMSSNHVVFLPSLEHGSHAVCVHNVHKRKCDRLFSPNTAAIIRCGPSFKYRSSASWCRRKRVKKMFASVNV